MRYVIENLDDYRGKSIYSDIEINEGDRVHFLGIGTVYILHRTLEINRNGEVEQIRLAVKL